MRPQLASILLVCSICTACRPRPAPARASSDSAAITVAIVDAGIPDDAALAAAAPREKPSEVNALDEERNWASVSDRDPSIEIEQRASGPSECNVTSKRGARELWSMHQCLALASEQRIVSPDGEGLLVLDRSPAVDVRPTDAQIATLIRHAVILRKLVAGDLDPSGRGLRVESGRLVWLAPQTMVVDPQGITLTLADMRSATIFWSGRRPLVKAAPEIVRDLSCRGGCKYVDESGAVQLVTDFDDIPERFRKSATQVHATDLNLSSAPASSSGNAQPGGPVQPPSIDWRSLEASGLAYPADGRPRPGTTTQPIDPNATREATITPGAQVVPGMPNVVAAAMGYGSFGTARSATRPDGTVDPVPAAPPSVQAAQPVVPSAKMVGPNKPSDDQ